MTRRVVRLIPTLFALAFVGLAAQSAWAWAEGPTLGVRVSLESSDQYLVTDVHPGGIGWFAGVSAGDRLIDIDGQHPSERDVSGWVAGESLRAVAVDGEVLTGQLESRGASGVATFIGLGATALSFAAVAVLIAARQHQTIRTITLSTTMFLSGIAIVLGPSATLQRPLEQSLEVNLVPWATAALMWTIHLGVRSTSSGLWKCSRWAAIFATATALTLNIAWTLTFTIVPDIYTLTRTVFFLTLTGLLAMSALVVALAWWRSRDPRLNRVLKILSVGFAAAVLPVVVLSFMPFLITGDFWIRPEMASASAMAIPAAIGLSASRSQPFGIGAIINPRGLRILAISVSVPAVVLIALLEITGPDISETESIALLMFLVAMAMPFPLVVAPYLRRAGSRETRNDEFARLSDDVTELSSRAPDLEFLTGQAESLIAEHFDVTYVAISRDSSFPSVDSEVDLTASRSVPIPSNAVHDRNRWRLSVGPKLNGQTISEEDSKQLQSLALTLSSGVDRLGMIRQLRELSTKMVEVDEQARALAAAELHDDSLQLAQYLVRALASSEDPEIRRTSRELSDKLRDLSMRLSATQVSDLGLVESLRELVTSFQIRSSCRVDLRVEPEIESAYLSSGALLAIYRVLQEALTNVQKHAQATACWVSLSVDSDAVSLTISDNGIGVGASNVPGLGIWSMRGRVETLGGSLHYSPRPSRGTTLSASIPIQSADKTDD